MKLCIFPNDPIIAYYEKGEIKPRYYNPNNFFDEIDIISLTKKDVDESKVKIGSNTEVKIKKLVSQIDEQSFEKSTTSIISRYSNFGRHALAHIRPFGFLIRQIRWEIGPDWIRQVPGPKRTSI